MTADMPEYAREEFGGKIDDYDRALHHEIAVQLAASQRHLEQVGLRLS